MVELIQTDSAIYIQPWVNGLDLVLTCKRKVQTIERGKLKYSYENMPLYYKMENSCVTYPGLFNDVLLFLKFRKEDYVVKDQRSPIPPADIDKILAELREGQPEVLASIFSSYRGVIVSPCGTGKTFVIEQLCRVYEEQNILIITSRKSVLHDIHRRVEKAIPNSKPALIFAGKSLPTNSKIAVCSSKSLHKIPTDWPHILLFDEVHGSAARKVSQDLVRFSGSRMFGFTASPKGRGDKSEKLIEALFGQPLCTISYEEAVTAKNIVPIVVRMVPVRCAEIERTFPVARERYNIWRNNTRNSAIARVAREYDCSEQVLILVRTVEHALYLRKLLPDYTVVHAGISTADLEGYRKAKLVGMDEDMKIDVTAAKNKFRSGELRKVIVTSCWSEGVDFPNLRVLIRADASSGEIPSIQIGGRLSRIVEGKDYGLLIDFTDEFGYSFSKRSSSRKKVYAEQGWKIMYD
jgi:superfamily II DNA or RNA helicase